MTSGPTPTGRASAIAHQLLARYGVVTREAAGAESIPGAFSTVYPVLKSMEEAGRIRRGYFVAGLGATQFAGGASLDLLRSFRDEPDETETFLLSAVDPANPYGTLLKWPSVERRQLARTPGAHVILVNGALACYVGRGEKGLLTFLPDDEPARSATGREIAAALAGLVQKGERRALLIAEVDGVAAVDHPLRHYLVASGFSVTSQGLQLRAPSRA
jgi:ATP-dependent Lhr-like helicase